MTGRTVSSGKTYVLVHGAWHGGWCWRRVVPRLAAAGHRVLTATLTGLGERAHLLTPGTGLSTFAQDVMAVIEAEEAEDVVLVGHSFGGVVITMVADRMAERIARLVYLDATVLRSGESAFSVLAPDIVAARRRAAAASPGGLTMPVPSAAAFGVSEPADAAWLMRRLTPHPLKSYEDVVALAHPFGHGLPKTYVACTAPDYAALAAVRARVRAEPGWDWRTLATGHDAMVTAPQALADLLLDLAV